MKKLIFGAFLSTLFVLFSCSEDTPEPTPEPTGSTMTANVNGNAWSSLQGGVVASIIEGGGGGDFQRTLQITGSSLSMTSMSISIPIQDLSTGSQSFSGDFAPGFLSYFNGSSFFVSQHTSGNFTVNITALNLIDGKISGTFSGTLYDDNDVAMNVTNGVFTDVTIYSTNFFSNGSMALKRNGGTLFTMDGTTEDLKYLTITQSNANNSISLFGNNSTFTSDAGIYNISFPKNVAAGTYTLTNSGTYSAGLGNSDSEPEYSVTGGSLTISSHTGNTVTGTFNYTANNGVQTVTISNGSFSITHN
jgi:hypothetical protein